MITIIYSDEFLNHKTGKLHPESPDRLISICQKLKENQQLKNQLQWIQPTPIEESLALEWVGKIHDWHHIERVKLLAKRGGGKLDPDTPVSANSYKVALLAVSAWLDAMEQIVNYHQPSFILARPPGHHATASEGMGFCLFSNAAIASLYAINKLGVSRVAILDWDVHHGNGTQAIIESNPNIVYCSLHQSPCYPGTGMAEEKGLYNNVLNIPVKAGSGIKEYEVYFQKQVIPFLKEFRPDILIVSAGYDANFDDPLASMCLLPQDYGTLTKYCLDVTDNIIFGLEGGYHLEALAKSVEHTMLQVCKTVV